MKHLQRLTTAYNAPQDRVTLTGESADGEVVSLWLTQRLGRILITHLTQRLSKQTVNTASGGLVQERTDAVMQGFRQQAANHQLRLEPPVRADEGDRAFLVQAVDVTQGDKGVRLAFRDGADQTVGMSMSNTQLRQWLGIVYKVWVIAEWPVDYWPEWIREQVAPDEGPDAIEIH